MADRIPEDQWAIYQRVIDEARRAGIRFAVGGAFAVYAYTGMWRNTKDLDLYVLPADREAMIDVFHRCGLRDYFEQRPYDRRWIYRGYTDDIIVDAIWAMANQRAQVDEAWLTRGREVRLENETLRALPVEELLWNKLYVLQRDRCDWPDCLNMLQKAGPQMDWAHLLERMGDDLPLLRAALSVFGWLSPGRARQLPDWVWDRLRLGAPAQRNGPAPDAQRVDFLDSRPWFADRGLE